MGTRPIRFQHPGFPMFDPEEMVPRQLEGPPPRGFDCGREEQNEFLYTHAWADQQALLSMTYLVFESGILAGYVTVLLDSIRLALRERGDGVRFSASGAVKAGQIGVHRGFQGRGMGRFLVGTALSLARQTGEIAGCRYLTLDAQPELVGWYESLGFRRNLYWQEARLAEAVRHRRDPASVPVSMRLDLRE